MGQLFRKNLWFYIPYFIFLIVAGIILLLLKKTDIHLFINSIHCSAADFFFKYFTNLGDGIIPALTIFILLFISFRNAIILCLSSLLSTVTVHLFKEIILSDLNRPKFVFENIAELYYVPGVDIHLLNSFPSGHTVTAFSLFLFFALISKNNYYKLTFFIVAFLIGYSRMYLSQHFLMDIYFGSLFGVIFSTLSYFWVSKWKNKKLELSLLYTLRIKRND